MASRASRRAPASRAGLARTLLLALFVGLVGSGSACTCSKAHESVADDAGTASSLDGSDEANAASGEPGGLSAPIAAARGEHGDVVVAGLDVAVRAIRVQRISDKDEILVDRTIFDGVTWSSESELKVAPAAAFERGSSCASS
jgi:hypothetical protein